MKPCVFLRFVFLNWILLSGCQNEDLVFDNKVDPLVESELGETLLLEDYNSGTPGNLIPGWVNFCISDSVSSVFFSTDQALEGQGVAGVTSDNGHFRFFAQPPTGLIQIDMFVRPSFLPFVNFNLRVVGLHSFRANMIVGRSNVGWIGVTGTEYLDSEDAWYEIILRINTNTNKYDLYIGKMGTTLTQVEDEREWVEDISEGLIAFGLSSGVNGMSDFPPSYVDIIRVDLLSSSPGDESIPNIAPLPTVTNTWSGISTQMD